MRNKVNLLFIAVIAILFYSFSSTREILIFLKVKHLQIK